MRRGHDRSQRSVEYGRIGWQVMARFEGRYPLPTAEEQQQTHKFPPSERALPAATLAAVHDLVLFALHGLDLCSSR